MSFDMFYDRFCRLGRCFMGGYGLILRGSCRFDGLGLRLMRFGYVPFRIDLQSAYYLYRRFFLDLGSLFRFLCFFIPGICRRFLYHFRCLGCGLFRLLYGRRGLRLLCRLLCRNGFGFRHRGLFRNLFNFRFHRFGPSAIIRFGNSRVRTLHLRLRLRRGSNCRNWLFRKSGIRFYEKFLLMFFRILIVGRMMLLLGDLLEFYGHFLGLLLYHLLLPELLGDHFVLTAVYLGVGIGFDVEALFIQKIHEGIHSDVEFLYYLAYSYTFVFRHIITPFIISVYQDSKFRIGPLFFEFRPEYFLYEQRIGFFEFGTFHYFAYRKGQYALGGIASYALE